MWDLIVSVPDHCLSFYFGKQSSGMVNITSIFSNNNIIIIIISIF